LFDGGHRALVDARQERVDTGQAAPDRCADGQGPVVVVVTAAAAFNGPFGEQNARRVTGQEQRDRKREMNAAGHVVVVPCIALRQVLTERPRQVRSHEKCTYVSSSLLLRETAGRSRDKLNACGYAKCAKTDRARPPDDDDGGGQHRADN